ncbi:hypothetical protein Tco_1530515 [Tanacetum coccineum]
MTNSEHPSLPPILTLVEKLYAVHNINSLIPAKLDLAKSNYSTWSYFFKGDCSNFGVLKPSKNLSPRPRRRLYQRTNGSWLIPSLKRDNKRTCTISLKGELRVIQMGDQTADEYFSKIEAILALLTDLAHKDPFLDLATVRSMVATEELRLRSRSSILPIGTTLSTPCNSNNSTTHRTTQGTLPMHVGSKSGGLNVSQQQQLLCNTPKITTTQRNTTWGATS